MFLLPAFPLSSVVIINARKTRELAKEPLASHGLLDAYCSSWSRCYAVIDSVAIVSEIERRGRQIRL